VYQDRFFNELRLRKITAIAEANDLLAGGFEEQLNKRLARAPKDAQDAHRPVPKKLDLRDVFCTDEKRAVAKDWTLRHQNHTYQILRLNEPLPSPGVKVVVRTWLDGSIHLLYREHRLVFRILSDPQPKITETKKCKPAPPRAKPKPARTHPWRRAVSRPKKS
jgi:hypothetical protein